MSERDDIIETLTAHRGFLRHTVQGLTEEQARLKPTVSELCLGGLIKHVAHTERSWADFVVNGPRSGGMTEERYAEWAREWVLGEGETLESVLAAYEKIAAATDELVRTLPDLDARHPLEEAPWFPKGATRSARRVFLHIVAETSQHAGHADIIRESIDGQKTMG